MRHKAFGADCEVIKLCLMLNSTVHEISTAYKTKIPKNKDFFCFYTIRCIYHA